MTRIERGILIVYALWAAGSIGLSLAMRGLDADNATRLLIVGYLAATLGWHLVRRPTDATVSASGFITRCTLHALVIEATYMISRPVFAALTVNAQTPIDRAVVQTLTDFAFTAPAYVVIFYVVWRIIGRWHYGIAEYALLFSLGQALGDGNAFFLANPAMLLLAPYVMLNYQAINITPYLRIRPRLPPQPSRSPWKYAAPLVLIPAAYWMTGACILAAGRRLGLA